ncbi:MAG: hypothetical protein R3C52_07250 [Hyphomonadaceae bacterium]
MQTLRDEEGRARRRRRSLMAALAILIMTALQVLTFRREVLEAGSIRLVDAVQLAGFVVLALVLALRSTTAFRMPWRRPELNDELVVHNRGSAARWGFWALVVCGLAALVATYAFHVSGYDTLPFLVTIGVGAAAARFAFLEREEPAEE